MWDILELKIICLCEIQFYRATPVISNYCILGAKHSEISKESLRGSNAN